MSYNTGGGSEKDLLTFWMVPREYHSQITMCNKCAQCLFILMKKTASFCVHYFALFVEGMESEIGLLYSWEKSDLLNCVRVPGIVKSPYWLLFPCLLFLKYSVFQPFQVAEPLKH